MAVPLLPRAPCRCRNTSARSSLISYPATWGSAKWPLTAPVARDNVHATIRKTAIRYAGSRLLFPPLTHKIYLDNVSGSSRARRRSVHHATSPFDHHPSSTGHRSTRCKYGRYFVPEHFHRSGWCNFRLGPCAPDPGAISSSHHNIHPLWTTGSLPDASFRRLPSVWTELCAF